MPIQRLTLARPLTGRKSTCASWSSPTEWLGRSHSDYNGPHVSDSEAVRSRGARGVIKASGPPVSETKVGFKAGLDYEVMISFN